MQVAYGQVLIGVSALVQAAVDCCIDLAPTSSEDGPDPLQFAKVVFSHHQLMLCYGGGI